MRIRIERLGDNFFADARAVGIRGVYEINSEGNGAAEDLDGFGTILGLAPNSLAGDAHGSVAQTVDGKVATDFEGAGFGGGRFLVDGFCGCGAHMVASNKEILLRIARFALGDQGPGPGYSAALV